MFDRLDRDHEPIRQPTEKPHRYRLIDGIGLNRIPIDHLALDHLGEDTDTRRRTTRRET